MMHTHSYGDTVRFHHHGDYGGEAYVVEKFPNGSWAEIKVSTMALLAIANGEAPAEVRVEDSYVWDASTGASRREPEPGIILIEYHGRRVRMTRDGATEANGTVEVPMEAIVSFASALLRNRGTGLSAGLSDSSQRQTSGNSSSWTKTWPCWISREAFVRN